jgi:hypothetical protein
MIALGLTLFAAIASEAASVSIKGTVKNRSGSPIAGASVALESHKLVATTNSAGAFELIGTVGVAGRASVPGGVGIESGRIRVDLDARECVRIERLDASGAVVSANKSDVDAGHAVLDLPRAPAGTSMSFLRVTVGASTWTFRVVEMKGEQPRIVSLSAGRAAAVDDSLKITASGYVAKQVRIASYEQPSLEVVLDATSSCNPADKTGDPVPVSLTGMGANPTGSHQVVVETDPTLDGYTIYRPKDLGDGKKYPIAAWANGACATSGTELRKYLREIASHGYVVIVDGKPNGTGGRDMGAGMTVLGGYLLKAINWAIAQNGKPCSRFYRSLDTTKLASFGASCGGLMAYGAAIDPRMTTTLIMNSGLMGPDPAFFAKIHAPIAYVCGGPSDIAYNNGKRDFGNMNTQPTIFANVPAVGHAGTYYNDNGGEYGKLVVAWFNWWLKNDLGTTGRLKFVGGTCAFCSGPWTFDSKKLP